MLINHNFKNNNCFSMFVLVSIRSAPPYEFMYRKLTAVKIIRKNIALRQMSKHHAKLLKQNT